MSESFIFVEQCYYPTVTICPGYATVGYLGQVRPGMAELRATRSSGEEWRGKSASRIRPSDFGSHRRCWVRLCRANGGKDRVMDRFPQVELGHWVTGCGGMFFSVGRLWHADVVQTVVEGVLGSVQPQSRVSEECTSGGRRLWPAVGTTALEVGDSGRGKPTRLTFLRPLS
jgi:hypothetical protein